MALTDLLKKFEQKGGGYKITDASGRNMTVNKEALDSNGLADYIDKNGNMYDTRNRPSNAGRRYKDDDSVWQAPEDRMNKTGKPINRVTNGNDTVSKLRGAITRGNVARNIQGGATTNQGIATNNQNVANNPNAVDLSNMYSQYNGGNFDAMKQAAQASLKSALSKLNPMRNSVDLGKERTLSGLREALANQGDKGGIGRQDMLGVNTSAENQQNNIDMQEQDTINTTQADLLRQLISEKNRQDDISLSNSRYEDEQDRYAQEREDEQLRYDNQRSDAEYEKGQDKLDEEKSNFIDTIGRYSNDFTAQRNNIANDGDPSNDWQIALLEAAARKKKSDAEAKYQEQGYVSEDIRAALGLPVGTMTAAYKDNLEKAMQDEQVNNTLKIFGQTGYLTPEMAVILKDYGLPTDTATLNALKAQYSTSKPYYSPNTGGGSSSNGGIPSQFLK
jgi:hypothetical protein